MGLSFGFVVAAAGRFRDILVVNLVRLGSASQRRCEAVSFSEWKWSKAKSDFKGCSFYPL